MLLGAHVSVSGGLHLAPERAREIGAQAAQIFSRNPRTWKSKPIGKREAMAFRTARENAGIEIVLAHASYLPNVASPAPGPLRRSRFALAREIDRALALGLDGLVLHPGAALGAPHESALRRVAESLAPHLDRARDGGLRILLENTAGAGTMLGAEFEDLARILEHVDGHPALGVCFDTAHAHGAGHDVSDRRLDATLRRLVKIVGEGRLAAFHLNDTPVDLGSRRDRHAGIGEGRIGLDPFRRLHRARRFARQPGILETPSGMDGWRREIAAIGRR